MVMQSQEESAVQSHRLYFGEVLLIRNPQGSLLPVSVSFLAQF
jgi:hypothetical protein